MTGSEKLTVGQSMETMDQAAAVVARGPLTGDRLGWLTYLLEVVDRELDDQAEYTRLLTLLRQELDGRLDRGRW